MTQDKGVVGVNRISTEQSISQTRPNDKPRIENGTQKELPLPLLPCWLLPRVR